MSLVKQIPRRWVIRCDCGFEPEILQRKNGRIFCKVCSKRVNRTSYRFGNCEHVTRCPKCKKNSIRIFRSSR